ncbi:hypothetical protein ACFVFJ_48570, partial [Streptomyces sp. NPDC057717]|uniref:hypothetical protein n=1 Tax=Streptomyces sp. NPDC057717 TaxID=3346224 RepID=UPI00367CB3BE
TTLYLKPHPTNNKAEFRQFTPHHPTTTIRATHTTRPTTDQNTPPTDEDNRDAKNPAHNNLQFAEFPA